MSRILVVEDDAAILRGLRDNLVAESYDVITAADGAEGLRLSQERDPDLIILDLMLPKLSGEGPHWRSAAAVSTAGGFSMGCFCHSM